MLPILILVLLSGSPRLRGGNSDSTIPNGRVREVQHTVSAAAGGVTGQFEFAPASGAGMTAACACTAVTGANGETMTFARASDGWCTKGNIQSGIANGDLVKCTSNQPRAMPGSDGTGAVGLLVEGSTTNDLLRSQEFDNAAWVKFGSGGGTMPTVTADQAVAPDGTTTADELTFYATSGVERSVLYQIPGVTQSSASLCVYVKGKTGSGTIDITMAGGGGAHWAPCSYNATTWTRCRLENKSITAGANSPFIGNSSSENGGIARPEQTLYLWQADETGTDSCTSPIVTTGTTATRAAETATFPDVTLTTAGSAAATISSTGSGGVVSEGNVARFIYTAGSVLRIFDGATVVGVTMTTLTPMVKHRVWSSWTGSTMTINDTTDALTNSGTFDGDMASAVAVEIGALAAVGALNGVIKQVCLDPSPTVCR